MVKKQDLRIVKTKKNIRQSFIKLLRQKDFSSITVQDILDEALINRTTFYKYYNSKYELAETLNAEIMQRFNLLLDISLQNRKKTDFMFENIEKLVTEFYDDRQTVLALWQVHTDGINLYDDMECLMKSRFQTFLTANKDAEDNIDFQTTIMAALILTTFKYLLKSDERYSVKELNIQVDNFFNKHFIKVKK